MSRYVTKAQALANPLRQRLLDIVDGRPGITMGEVASAMRCTPSTILWHATKLTKAGLLRTERVGNARVFFLAAGGEPLRAESVAAALLRNETARRIHDVVHRQPGITLRGLGALVLERVSSLRWHTKRLVDEGLLSLGEGAGRSVGFYPAPTACPRPSP